MPKIEIFARLDSSDPFLASGGCFCLHLPFFVSVHIHAMIVYWFVLFVFVLIYLSGYQYIGLGSVHLTSSFDLNDLFRGLSSYVLGVRT